MRYKFFFPAVCLIIGTFWFAESALPLAAQVELERSEAVQATTSTLVICPAGFDEALKPWIELRQSQGRTLIVKRPKTSSYALAQLIKETAITNSLDHVVLVGDAFNEADSTLEIPTDYIGAIVNVKFGSEPEIATDQTYCDFDADGIPDIPIGRLSVDNAAQLKLLVEKIIKYETNMDFGPWRRRIDLTAGTGGFGAIVDKLIETTAKQMITELIPAEYETTMTYASWTSPYCPDPRRFSKTTIDNLNRGGLFWVYIGHGHPLRLDRLNVPIGQYPIFEEDDCSKLDCRNCHPIGLMLSCYVGAFDFQNDCMGEKMVVSPGGPVAIIGGTRVTMPYAMSLLSLQMMTDLFETGESLTLGQLLNQAKRHMLEADSEKSEYRQMIEAMGKAFSPNSDLLDEELKEHVSLFHILGDPLLTLHRPKTLELNVAAEIENGTTFTVTGNSQVDGLMTVELVYRRDRLRFRPKRRKEFVADHDALCEYQDTYEKANNRTCASIQVQVIDGKFSVELDAPPEASGECIVRAHVAGSDSYSMGHATTFVKKTK